MIFQGSRYESADIVRMQHDGETRLTVVPTAPGIMLVNYAYHQVVDGDRLDILADQYLGDAELWWTIADANPQRSYFDLLEAGEIIRIPSGIRAR